MPTARTGDIEMYYETRGEGIPLLLIPGLGSDITDYQSIIRLLSGGCSVTAVDNRGAGRSDKPDIPYSIEMMAEDAAGLLKSLGLGPVFVLGHSMGGRIALALALGHPELVEGLVLVSTGARVSGKARRRVRTLGGIWRRTPGLRSRDAYPQPHYAFLRQFEASGGFDCSSRLPEIRVPALILHGTRDRIAPLALAEETHAGIAGSRFVTFRGGHLVFFMQSRLCISAIQEFLAAPRSRALTPGLPQDPG